MNSRRSENRIRVFARGQAAVEMAGVIPLLALMLLAATDFGRLYYTNIEVIEAARAGAQYGSQSVITAADASGMELAASSASPDVSGMTPTAKQCTCESGTTVTACPTSYCTTSPTGTFVEVDTAATYNTIVSWPGIPHSITLNGKAVMLVEQ